MLFNVCAYLPFRSSRANDICSSKIGEVITFSEFSLSYHSRNPKHKNRLFTPRSSIDKRFSRNKPVTAPSNCVSVRRIRSFLLSCRSLGPFNCCAANTSARSTAGSIPAISANCSSVGFAFTLNPSVSATLAFSSFSSLSISRSLGPSSSRMRSSSTASRYRASLRIACLTASSSSSSSAVVLTFPSGMPSSNISAPSPNRFARSSGSSSITRKNFPEPLLCRKLINRFRSVRSSSFVRNAASRSSKNCSVSDDEWSATVPGLVLAVGCRLVVASEKGNPASSICITLAAPQAFRVPAGSPSSLQPELVAPKRGPKCLSAAKPTSNHQHQQNHIAIVS